MQRGTRGSGSSQTAARALSGLKFVGRVPECHEWGREPGCRITGLSVTTIVLADRRRRGSLPTTPALDGWLNSPHHRENLFRPEWRTQGIAVQKIAKFGRDRNMTLWVNQFGDE
jgi:hypothetical protein